MSVVIAVKDGDRVLVAADSQFSRGDSKGLLLNPASMKVWRPTGHTNVVMGGAGALRDLNILSTRDQWYDPLLDDANKTLDFKFAVRELVPEIMNELTAFGRTSSDRNGSFGMDSTFIFARKDNFFRIDSDGAVTESVGDGDAEAVGSGAVVTMAAFNVLRDIKEIDLEEKLIRAVSQACEDDLYVNYPIIIMDTTSEDVQVFDGVELYTIGTEEEEEIEEDAK